MLNIINNLNGSMRWASDAFST